MKLLCIKRFIMIAGLAIVLLFSLMIFTSEHVCAGSYDGEDLALAILKDESTFVSSSYTDNDEIGHRQAIVLSSLGTMTPTHNNTFALFSTGVAGYVPVTTDEENPGDERGTWFRNKNGHPRDFATLTMTLQVPLYLHYLYYDVQFFTSEYPEYVGGKYNDKLTITVNSPSRGTSEYVFDVNSGYFVLDSHDIPGTGFDTFAQSGIPAELDIVDRTPRNPGADAGASNLIPIGGVTHPVSPGEQITVTINIEDAGDNLVDTATFIDNLRFSGYAKTEIIALKDVTDLNGNETECNDTLKYTITISNTGSADQSDNPGNEFEDYIPEDTTYVAGSAYSQYGNISYDPGENKIIWNGNVPAESSRVLEFKVIVNESLPNGYVVSNQGTVYWDSNENGTNDATELTDDVYIDDGIDQDGDGETDDDDPTDITIYAFDYPAYVKEDFSDDTPGGNATQLYLTRQWFETQGDALWGSCFEVASTYHYSTARSFKTQLRQSDGPQYWNYSLSTIEGEMKWWEIWFSCGDTSEEYDLYLDLQNNNEQDIAKIRFDYVKAGSKPQDWFLELYFYDPVNGWIRLNSFYFGGYLRNNWYKLRIEKNGTSSIYYTLSMNDIGVVDNQTGGQLSVSFSDFERVKWSSTTNPDSVVCPMFFWDEHSIGLTYPT
jgi:uncharacterized repeat protein (TIGR01451 family)